MANIIFDIYGASGHLNSTFKLAQLLKMAGHEIIFATQSNFSQSVINNGFNFVNVPESFIAIRVYHLYLNESKVTSPKKKAIEIESDMIMKPFLELISSFKPDLVILDSIRSNKFIPYYIHNIPVILVQTMLATDKLENIPPLSSVLLPNTSILFQVRNAFSWNLIFITRTFDRFLSFFKFPKYQSNIIFDFLLKHHSIDKAILNKTRWSQFSISCYPEFILGPEDFDFPRTPSKKQHFIGPLIDLKRDIPDDPRYLSIIEHIQIQKQIINETKLIYLSLGTLTTFGIKNTGKFFKKVVSLSKLTPKWQFILSVGEFYDINCLGQLPPNVHIFKRVPQLHLLENTDVMITHAGLNTITECVFNEVPMLAYPLMTDWDQNGNAARIVYHGLGLRGVLKRASPKIMKKKLHKIFDNYQFYKQNLEKMHLKFDKKNNSNDAVKIIEQILINKTCDSLMYQNNNCNAKKTNIPS